MKPPHRLPSEKSAPVPGSSDASESLLPMPTAGSSSAAERRPSYGGASYSPMTRLAIALYSSSLGESGYAPVQSFLPHTLAPEPSLTSQYLSTSAASSSSAFLAPCINSSSRMRCCMFMTRMPLARPASRKVASAHSAVSATPALAHRKRGHARNGGANDARYAMKLRMRIHVGLPMARMQTLVCSVTLITPLPRSVAPKKVQKGTSSQPHAIPHMSNAAFGHEASSRIPTKPCFCVKSIVHTFMRLMRSVPLRASSSSSSKSLARAPARLAARVMKYGGSSPIAVPEPHSTTAGSSSSSSAPNVSVPSDVDLSP